LNEEHLQSRIDFHLSILSEFSGQERHVVSLNEYSFSLHEKHSIPFPIYPGLHLHSKLPIVFVQIAFISHPPLFVEHSSISVKFLLLKRRSFFF